MRKNLFLTALILMQSIATGCGGDGLTRVRVEGMLTSNGQPLANATVQFIPEGSTKGEGGIGRSSKDGAFQLTGSRDGASGVVPGEYKVRVSLMVDSKGLPLPPDARDAEYPGSYDAIPSQYSSPSSSLKVKVPDSGGKVTVDIPTPIGTKK